MYFTAWVEEAQRLEKERMANANAEVTSHPGFGLQDEAIDVAWSQFFEYVGWLNDGSPDYDYEEKTSSDEDPDEEKV
jgi:hypothetical protein